MESCGTPTWSQLVNWCLRPAHLVPRRHGFLAFQIPKMYVRASIVTIRIRPFETIDLQLSCPVFSRLEDTSSTTFFKITCYLHFL
jgi:hypothetical protein